MSVGWIIFVSITGSLLALAFWAWCATLNQNIMERRHDEAEDCAYYRFRSHDCSHFGGVIAGWVFAPIALLLSVVYCQVRSRMISQMFSDWRIERQRHRADAKSRREEIVFESKKRRQEQENQLKVLRNKGHEIDSKLIASI